MTRRGMWTDAELAILRESYTTGGMEGARRALPHRTESSIAFKAWEQKLKSIAPRWHAGPAWTAVEIADLRRVYPTGGAIAFRALHPRRNLTAVWQKAKALGIVTSAQRPRAPVAAPVAAPKPILRVGPCDRGDIEFLRRRMEFVIAGCAGELKRTPSSVREAIIALAKSDFKPDAIAKLSIGLYDAETSL